MSRLAAPILLCAMLVLGPPAAASTEQLYEDDVPTVERAPYPGDPDAEAGFVAAEDDRIVEVRTVDALAQFSEFPLTTPYRLATGSAYTLVLTSRRDAYTIEDLLTLAPQTFVRQPDGAYLLSEHLVILSGATLNLSSSGGLRLLLASDENGFVSIVNHGGRLNVRGAAGAPVEISSFDRNQEGPDTETTDGRAYVRSVGGQVIITDAVLSDLGFWSGRTGGLSLTGTDRPNSGALDDLGETLEVGKRHDRERETLAADQPPTPEQSLDGAGRSTLSEVLPSGDLPVPEVDVDNPEYSYVSAAMNRTTVTGNAFGIFVSGADGLDIRETSVSNSLVDGIVMHRFVTNAVLATTSASDNGGDGVVLARATTGIVLSEITANGNVRNGLTMSGLPLAEGPSATGISVGSYGNNSVSNSEMSNNGRYGVEVIGGINLGVLANTISGNDMGVVVREGADRVNVVGNRVSDNGRQGISLRDGVKDTTVSGNIVSGGETSVYLRDVLASVRRNTLSGASTHAVSLVGDLGASELVENTISGKGPSAVDVVRATDLDSDDWDNDMSGWEDTTPLLVTLKRFLQPLTLMWILLAALLVLTAVRGARSRRTKAHPYADKAPVGGAVVLPAKDLDGAGV